MLTGVGFCFDHVAYSCLLAEFLVTATSLGQRKEIPRCGRGLHFFSRSLMVGKGRWNSGKVTVLNVRPSDRAAQRARWAKVRAKKSAQRLVEVRIQGSGVAPILQ